MVSHRRSRPDPDLDLHRSWPALHHLLTRTAGEVDGPAAPAVPGGGEIGDEGDYGPARLLDVETVRVVAIALDMQDVDASRDRFRPRRRTCRHLHMSPAAAIGRPPNRLSGSPACDAQAPRPTGHAGWPPDTTAIATIPGMTARNPRTPHPLCPEEADHGPRSSAHPGAECPAGHAGDLRCLR
ncbi:DUF1877 family protein [Micromonospora arida]|uniref:DUF1877 family protein n=1 Tax=Micromonospora arida TaxID=2203715 RepID=UPI0033BDBAF5